MSFLRIINLKSTKMYVAVSVLRIFQEFCCQLKLPSLYNKKFRTKNVVFSKIVKQSAIRREVLEVGGLKLIKI